MLSRRFLKLFSYSSGVSKRISIENRGFFTKIVQARIFSPNLRLPKVIGTKTFSNKVSSDSALVEFLKKEIEAERQISKASSGEGLSISGFEIVLNQREIILSKKFGEETIAVQVDVNHSVTPEVLLENNQFKEGTKLICKPDFIVQITTKGDQKLVFECSYTEESDQNEYEFEDKFDLDVIYVFSGQSGENQKFYAVSGGIIDGTLYDHLMNSLDERGINNTFVQQLSNFATYYEHMQYIGLLEKLRDFLIKDKEEIA